MNPETLKMTVCLIAQPRPADAPDGWIICTAPRPLWGQEVESDTFFKVAVNPVGEDAAAALTFNAEQKAQVFEFINAEQLEAMVQAEQQKLRDAGELQWPVTDDEMREHIRRNLPDFNREATVEELL